MRSNTNFVQEHYSLLWVISGRGVADVPGVRNPELADLIRKIRRFINIFPYKPIDILIIKINNNSHVCLVTNQEKMLTQPER